MFLKCRTYIFLIILSEVSIHFGNSYARHDKRRQNIQENGDSAEKSSAPASEKNLNNKRKVKQGKCWLHINTKDHFNFMDKLDERYADIRKKYHDAAQRDNFDGKIIEAMIKNRGAAARDIQRADGDIGHIPAGIDLGGDFMMRMPNSLLFFHRLKLRNNTHFRLTYLHNDLENLTLTTKLSLNDLHLVGSFDRFKTDKDPSILYYTPTYGQVEFLLKNVQYVFEGRYRLLNDKLRIDLIISNMDFDDVMMTYIGKKNNEGIRLQRKNIDDFLIRLKSDLDKWLKDYFNDYLTFLDILGKNGIEQFQRYNNEREMELNEFTERIIKLITNRLHEEYLESIKLPKFTIVTANSMELLLKDGNLGGLFNMHRRSIATGKKEGNIRKLDVEIGFSRLIVSYHYETLPATPPHILSGTIMLNLNDVIAHMAVTIGQDSDTVDIQFEFLEQATPDRLLITEPGNGISYNYLLKQHLHAILTSTLHFNLKMLGSLTRCVPLLYGNQDSSKVSFEDGRTVTTNNPNLNSTGKPERNTNSKSENNNNKDPTFIDKEIFFLAPESIRHLKKATNNN